jgi:uncharacterized membrane protein
MFALTLIAVVGSGVVAGIWFTFSNFVMAALARLPAEQGAAAMRAINLTVLNAGFFLFFFGTGAASLAVVVLSLVRQGQPGSGLLSLGCVLYLVGSIGVTIFRNVPLNEALEAAEPGTAEEAALWSQYLADWTFWNHVRAAGTAAAAVTFSVALAVP